MANACEGCEKGWLFDEVVSRDIHRKPIGNGQFLPVECTAEKPQEGKRNSFREALEALADKMEERCGDHCSNSCKICEYRNDLRLILARTAWGAK